MAKSEKPRSPPKAKGKSGESATKQHLVEKIKKLQTENESLKIEITKPRRVPSGMIGITLVIFGALSLIFSSYKNSQVLAFIGLGLTFWGALFFFVRPIKYVRSSLLDSTAISSYSTIDRAIKDLNYRGKSFYIPPIPKEVYLPQYLTGLKDLIVFISASSRAGMPSIEEMAKSKFLLKNPKGICVAPPGLGLLTQFENELKQDLNKLDLNKLSESLPKLILENFELAKDIEMQARALNQVYVKISDSIYKHLYAKEQNLKSVHFLGCPLVSAIAGAIAKTTGKIVTIQRDEVSPDGQTIQVWYRIIEG